MIKKRIVILSAFLSPHRSGAEAMVEEVTKRLQDRYDFTIVTSRLQRSLPKRDTLHRNIPVIRVGLGCRFDKWLFPLLAPFVARRLHPDLIHAVLESYAGFALILCKWVCRGVKRLLTLQSTNTDLLLGPIHRSPDAITGISAMLLERARQWQRNDVVYIPNGIDVAAIEKAVNAQKRVPGRVLFVGRLRHMKGVDTLLMTFARLKDQNVSLRLIGDGPDRMMLERFAADLGITDRVTFVGYVSTPLIYDEFAQAEIFCGLSRHEALGNVFLEAQAAGCAIVGTNIEGIPEIVKDDETGLLVPMDDPHSAAAALQSLLSNAELRSRLASQAKEHASAFDWHPISERYAAVYDQLLS